MNVSIVTVCEQLSGCVAEPRAEPSAPLAAGMRTLSEQVHFRARGLSLNALRATPAA